MRVALLLCLVAAGCYRESSTKPIVTNTTDHALIAEDASCKHGDDLENVPGDRFPEGRLRTQTIGQLSGATGRTWKGEPVPEYIPMKAGTLELFLLDVADGGHLAFYREPYNLNSCTLGGKKNCSYELAFFNAQGKREWYLPLNALMSRPDGIEVQDIRLSNGIVYFNEACQSYSSEQQGRCSSLVAFEPRRAALKWRTPPLVSNGRFVVRGCYIIAGYGFTSEPDNLFLVERASGKVVQTLPVSSAPQQYSLINKERMDLTLYSGMQRRYMLDGIESHSGRIIELDAPEPIYGGAGYGGAAYGGHGYGGATYGKPRRR